MMKKRISVIVLLGTLLFSAFDCNAIQPDGLTYRIVDTGVSNFYNNTAVIQKPQPGKPFFGQDAHYQINTPSYTDNKDGTITDNVTGLMWQKTMSEKTTLDSAKQRAHALQLGGYQDWRVPTIKELYSLIQFTGMVEGQKAIIPFIDPKYFDQPTGNARLGDRALMSN